MSEAKRTRRAKRETVERCIEAPWLEGADTLEECARKLEEEAALLRKLASQGWRLDGPMDELGHGHAVLPPHLTRAEIESFHFGRLGGARGARVAKHLKDCLACSGRAERWKASLIEASREAPLSDFNDMPEILRSAVRDSFIGGSGGSRRFCTIWDETCANEDEDGPCDAHSPGGLLWTVRKLAERSGANQLETFLSLLMGYEQAATGELDPASETCRVCGDWRPAELPWVFAGACRDCVLAWAAKKGLDLAEAEKARARIQGERP